MTVTERAGAAVHYAVDPGASRFVVKVFVGGMLANLGHQPTIAIHDYAGEVVCVPGAIEDSHFQAFVKTSSFKVIDDINERDRREIEATMREKVLETEKFPEIRFESTQITAEKALEGLFRVALWGNLKLHGVVRKQHVSAQLAFLGNMIRASGEFGLRQTDFGIRLYSFAAGALQLKDELKFSFDLVARRKV